MSDEIVPNISEEDADPEEYAQVCLARFERLGSLLHQTNRLYREKKQPSLTIQYNDKIGVTRTMEVDQHTLFGTWLVGRYLLRELGNLGYQNQTCSILEKYLGLISQSTAPSELVSSDHPVSNQTA